MADLFLFSDYMNGFKCNVTGSISTVPVAHFKVVRRCGADPKTGKLTLRLVTVFTVPKHLIIGSMLNATT